jgi:signal transduction histidine kinase
MHCFQCFLHVLLLLVTGILDYLTGYEISFSIFYLIPISYLVWYTNKTYGLLLALLSSAVWLALDMLGGPLYSSHVIYLWNALVRLGFFIIVVYLINLIKNANSELEQKVISRTKDLTAEVNERKKAQEELNLTATKLRQLTMRLQTIREEENSAIAREIHDELGQALTAIKIDVAWLGKRYSNDSTLVEGLMNVSNTIDDTIKSIRKISTRLRPRLLDELGLIPAIQWQVKDFQKRTGIQCRMNLPDDEIQLDNSISSPLFRIFQEAITNIARHSKATEADLSIAFEKNGNLSMSIKDNGIGLPDDYLNKNHSLGIVGMQERAKSINGFLEIKRSAEGGTEITMKVPFINYKL